MAFRCAGFCICISMMKTAERLFGLLIAFANIVCLAPVPSYADEFTIDVIQMQRVEKVYTQRRKKKYDARKFIPKMDPSKDTFQVGLKVMTHSIQSYIEEQKEEETGQDNPSRKVGDVFESNIEFLRDTEFKQNISFRVKAAESTASVRYRGITDASVNYIIGKDAVRMDVMESLIPGMALMYSYLSAHDESRHTVSMNFSW